MIKEKTKTDVFKENAKKKVISGIQKTAFWVEDNKELLYVLVPVVGAASIGSARSKRRRKDKKHERDIRDLTVYDRSAGHEWKLRRKLSSSEWLYIERRKGEGEKLGNILESLKVLR